ncbi:MAG TPA: LysM domain-containing protein [Chloroflexota bacterium]|nr:LysM domain-containing protein [Chloroflexota bacterium]
MSSDYPETDFDDLEPDESPATNADTPAPYQSEVQQIVDARLSAIQDESAARRRRMEYLKFGFLAVILLVVVIAIALAQPLIFDRIVPAVMGGEGSTAVLDDSQPADTPASGQDSTTAPQDNTQNLPIISVPGSDGIGTGGEGEDTGGAEEATAVPAQIYVVQLGDTLNSIARQFNTTVEAIAAANNIQNPDALLVGATLIIPQPVQ